MRKLIVLVGLSRVRLGLLAAIASVGLAFPAAAQAAPPDPVTLGATTLSNIRLNGVPGTQLVVAPGANVTITADWVDNNHGLPGLHRQPTGGFPGIRRTACRLHRTT
jgi:hypothetical protein